MEAPIVDSGLRVTEKPVIPEQGKAYIRERLQSIGSPVSLFHREEIKGNGSQAKKSAEAGAAADTDIQEGDKLQRARNHTRLRINGQGKKEAAKIYQELLSQNNGNPNAVEKAVLAFRESKDQEIKGLFHHNPHATNQQKHESSLQRRAAIRLLNSVLQKARYEQKSEQDRAYRQQARVNIIENKSVPDAVEMSKEVKRLKGKEVEKTETPTEVVELEPQTLPALEVSTEQLIASQPEVIHSEVVVEDADIRTDNLVKKAAAKTRDFVARINMLPAVALRNVRTSIATEQARRAEEQQARVLNRQQRKAEQAEARKIQEKNDDRVPDPGRRIFLRRAALATAGIAVAGLTAGSLPPGTLDALAAGLTPTPTPKKDPSAQARVSAEEEARRLQEEAARQVAEKAVQEEAARQKAQVEAEAARAAKAAEEAELKKAKDVIAERRKESVKFFGGEQRLSELQKANQEFQKAADKLYKIKVKGLGGEVFEVPVAFAESSGYQDVNGQGPIQGGRASGIDLQTRINSLLKDPKILAKIRTREDALQFTKDYLIATDCAGLVGDIARDVLPAWDKLIGISEHGNQGATAILQAGKAERGGFKVLSDNIDNVAVPGGMVVFVEPKNPNEGGHVMIVTEVGINSDDDPTYPGRPYVVLAQNTDVVAEKGQVTKGANYVKMIVTNPHEPLAKQEVQDNLYDPKQLGLDNPELLRFIAREQGVNIDGLTIEQISALPQLQGVSYGVRFMGQGLAIIRLDAFNRLSNINN